ncbi:MAG: N-acetylmuramoyl-L-alanine amidase [Armatimonadetes bacterium]|nr:N-acetylmuramoyl-L-alanine amidase [Armatimonadota bacterium]
MKIALDAGHGYKANSPTGARGNNLIEDDLALKIVHKLRWYLLQAGVEVTLTRPDQAFVALGIRGTLAKSKQCDMFISIHINASSNSDASGVEALAAENDHHSADFAKKLLDVIVQHGLKRRGVKWDSQSQHSKLRVLRDTYKAMPAALLEIGFITNTCDAAKLRNEKWLDELANDLADVINSPQHTK